MIFVASAGNNGADPSPQPFYPAALPHVIGVGALDHNRLPADFSNKTSAKAWALGVNVVSAFHRGWLHAPPYQDTEYTSGLAQWSSTSFSTPRVTGVLSEYVAGAKQRTTWSGALDWLAHQPFPHDDTGSPLVP